MITPILIDFENDSWENPEIATEVFMKCSPSEINFGCFDGNLVRIWINSDEHSAHIVATVSDKIYSSLDEEFNADDFASWLFCVLFEDIWMPGGEQFCFTGFGKKLEVFSKSFEFSVSPDICVHYDGKESGWNWSS